MQIPVYLITGFLESGKTTMIKETLNDPEFTIDEKTLILRFEEGLEEYDSEFLKNTKSTVISIPEKDVNEKTFAILNHEMKDIDRVFIEFNGMRSVNDFLQIELPEEWILVQILSMIDASTFGMYMSNMASLIYQQVQHSEVVIFNRCDENTKLSFLRSNIKAVNPRAQIVYEKRDGSIMEMKEEDLPFDLKAPIIDIADGDYGLWYMDALEHPRKYAGKKLAIKGMCLQKVEGSKHSFLLGRYAMVCCAEDMSPLGLVVSGVKLEEIHEKQWLKVTGEAILQKDDDNQEIIVLKALQLEHAEPLEDELVYFS